MNNQNMEMAWMLIASSDVPEVEKKLKKLEKKAEAYGIPFNWEIGSPRPYHSDTLGVVEVQDLSMSQSVIKSPDWEILAHLQQEMAGNVVTKICAEEVSPEWHKLECVCEHCNTRRNRKSTYLVRNTKSGEVRQVGKTCLKEYTGIYPYFTLGWADLLKYEEKLKNPTEHWEIGQPIERLYDVREIIARAAQEIAKKGYISTSQPGNTAAAVRKAMGTPKNERESIDKKYCEIAEKAIEWIKSEDTDNDFLCNLKILVESEYIRYKDIGRVCYLPVSYKREMDRQERERARREKLEKDREAEANSRFLGKIKERLTISLQSVEKVTTSVNQWGESTLYKMIDENGNVLTTWTSGDPFGCYVGNNGGGLDHLNFPLKIKGTVKQHAWWKENQQTVLTRVKMV